ncbi:MAG: hypothetical protein GXP28_02085 [Planctomycetes bacterium]|nr:hypothetical protein [Planctomycetota bacterium]
MLAMLAYQHLDQVPEQFDLFFHEEFDVRKRARQIISVETVPLTSRTQLFDKLVDVLNDPAQSKKHINAIRAISSAHSFPGQNKHRIKTSLLKIARESDKQLFGPALFALARVMASDVGIVRRAVKEGPLSEDRKKLLGDTGAIEKLILEEQRLMSPTEGGGGGFF